VFRLVPQLGFQSAIFKRKRLSGRTWTHPTFLSITPSSADSTGLQSLQSTRIPVTREAGTLKIPERTSTGLLTPT
jgi:hypothetical protein